MPSQIGIAFASLTFELAAVDNPDHAAAMANPAALFQSGDDAGRIGPPNPEHFSHEFLRHAQLMAADTILGRQDPAGETGIEFMHGVAGDGLQHLRQKAVCVAREMVAQGG